jgi:hypothetical protein
MAVPLKLPLPDPILRIAPTRARGRSGYFFGMDFQTDRDHCLVALVSAAVTLVTGFPVEGV